VASRLDHLSESLQQRLGDRAEALASGLAERGRDALHLLDERTSGVRQEVADAGAHVLEALRGEGERVRDSKFRLRGALEEVVQVLVGAVPHVGPYLSNLADRIDPSDG